MLSALCALCARMLVEARGETLKLCGARSPRDAPSHSLPNIFPLRLQRAQRRLELISLRVAQIALSSRIRPRSDII